MTSSLCTRHRNAAFPGTFGTDEGRYFVMDKSLDYRVLNLSVNTFNENNTAYWHKKY